MKIIFITLFCFQMAMAQEKKPVNTTICWDTSFSMRNRDLGKEFDLLDKIFQRSPNQEVQVLLFNTAIEEKTISIVDGDWSELKTFLIGAKADGATIYDGLEKAIMNENVYFFTDGNGLLSRASLPIKKGNYIINSVPQRNEAFLKKQSLIGRGRLMDFAAILPANLSKSKSTVPPPNKAITGIVYIDNVPASDVELRIKGIEKVFTTDTKGSFSLPAVPGDSILISSRSNNTMKTLPIGYFSTTVDVFMNANVNMLDEVIVTEAKIETATMELSDTANGLRSKESLGYDVQTIGDTDITPVNTELAPAIAGRVSGVNLGLGQDVTQFSTRLNTSLLGNNYGLIVIDGSPIQQSDSSPTGRLTSASFIDPESIAEIAVLKGFAATNRYGTLGNNGVLLITTKNGSYGKGSKKQKNTALAQNNVYDPTAKIKTTLSAITKALKNEASLAAAYDKYLNLRNFNEDSEAFYLDSFDFFKDKDKKLAARVISNLWELNPDKESYLRMVELGMRSVRDFSTAERINTSLKQMDPTALQPFFTSAQLHLEQGNYQKALDAWASLAKGGDYGTLKVNAIQKSLQRELKNLIFLKRSNLEVGGLAENYFKNSRMNVRLRIEWSNPKAAFQIQFVNPQNTYFNWEHTTAENKDRIAKETTLGFFMEEFELYDDLKGDWQINVNYLGNLDTENQEPLVVLCSIYTNFGYPSQRRELVWLYLNGQNRKKKIKTLKI